MATSLEKVVEDQVSTARTVEALEREATLTFGPGVSVTFNAQFPTADITAPDEFNIRIAEGMIVAGYRVEGDRRNIKGMAAEIRALRQVTDPLVISERSDGTNILCQGYRRYNGVLLIQREEQGSPLAEKLKYLPVLIYKGLTREQERQLVNDQRSQSFSKSDVFRYFEEQLSGGFHWLNICSRTYPQIGQVTGSSDKVAEINAIVDPKEKEKELRDWLTSFVYQGWVAGIKGGPLTRDLWLQTYLWQDKYKGVPRPRMVMDSARMRKIHSAIAEDTRDGNFNASTGQGPKMLAVIAGYEKEDNETYDENGNKKKKSKTPKEFVLRKASEVEQLVKDHTVNEKPNYVARILSISRKDGGDPDAVRTIKNFGKCKEVYDQHAAYLKPSVRSVLDLLFGGVEGSDEGFFAFLTDNYDPTLTGESTPAVEVPTPAAPVVNPTVELPTPEPEPEPLPVNVNPTVEAAAAELFTEPEHADADGTFKLGDGSAEHKEATDGAKKPDGSRKGKKAHK